MSQDPASEMDRAIDPAAPDQFGLVAVWWGDGKGKTTAATGEAIRAAGRGYRVHILRFMKGGWKTGENAVLDALPTASVETEGHPGWHGRDDGTDDTDHHEQAHVALTRAQELLNAAQKADLSKPHTGAPETGVHMLVLDELLYAVERDLIAQDTVRTLIETKPERLELLVTGGHKRPTYLEDIVDLISEVNNHKHPAAEGVPARRGIEY